MNRYSSLLTIALSLAFASVQAQIITPVDSRTGMLEGMNATLSNVDAPVVDYSEVTSPFVIMVKKVPVVATKNLDDIPVDTNPGEVLADEVALQVISNQFKPLGSMVMGTRGLLQLSNGQTIEEGDVFKAEIQGIVYEVTIGEVTSKSYTLMLGTANVEKHF